MRGRNQAAHYFWDKNQASRSKATATSCWLYYLLTPMLFNLQFRTALASEQNIDGSGLRKEEPGKTGLDPLYFCPVHNLSC
jgi:hypothetical protein